MSDGAIIKADKDFTKDVDKQLPEAEQLAQSNPQAAIDQLLILEKQTRQASDLASTSRIIVGIVTICKNSGDWSLLNEQILILSKKHGQLKQAVTKMVQVVMGFLDQVSNIDTKLSVIETLRTVTEGKIFVEVERARVTRILSNIKKEQGDIAAATDILCELQVETFGSMSRREKTEFILEQVALSIEKGDWTQAGILSRKISTRYFARKVPKSNDQLDKEKNERLEKYKKDTKEREEMEKKRKNDIGTIGAEMDIPIDEAQAEGEDDVTDLKLRYYEQQITLAKHEDKYLEVCKHYRQVLDTIAVENNPEQLRAALQRVIYFIILAPHDNEQSDLLHRIQLDPRNIQLPLDAQLLKLFTIPELMRWPMVAQEFGSHLCSSDVFSGTPSKAAPSKAAPSNTHDAAQRFSDLRKRVIEHNVRVIAKYYTRIQFSRLTALLDLSEDETEKYISELVTAKTIYAKIDRPARLVSFKKPASADDILNMWSGDMKGLFGLLERIDHLITKEEMMARIMPQVEAGKA